MAKKDVKFTIEISLGNDAMQSGPDVAKALRKVADFIEAYESAATLVGGGPIRDDNGNRVGKWGVW